MSSLIMSEKRGRAGAERSAAALAMASAAASQTARGNPPPYNRSAAAARRTRARDRPQGSTKPTGGLRIPPVRARISPDRSGTRPWLPTNPKREDRNVMTGERPATPPWPGGDPTKRDRRPVNPFFDIVDHSADELLYEGRRARRPRRPSFQHVKSDPIPDPIGKPVVAGTADQLRERREAERKKALADWRAARKATWTQYAPLARPSKKEAEKFARRGDWTPGGQKVLDPVVTAHESIVAQKPRPEMFSTLKRPRRKSREGGLARGDGRRLTASAGALLEGIDSAAGPMRHGRSGAAAGSASAARLGRAASPIQTSGAASSRLARGGAGGGGVDGDGGATQESKQRERSDQGTAGSGYDAGGDTGKVRFDETNLAETGGGGRRTRRKSREPYIPKSPEKKHTFRKPWNWVEHTDREKYELGPEEVVVGKMERMEKQLIADNDKWKTLMNLHFMLGSMPTFGDMEALGDKLRSANVRSRQKGRRKKKKHIDESDIDAMLETDSEDDIGGTNFGKSDSKLEFLKARHHYISRLYENLYRAQPNFIITRNRFVTALRMFATGGVKTTTKDSVLVEAFTAPLVAHAYKVAEAFGTGESHEFDWRQLLCALHLVSHPMLTALEQLRWFFMLYASKGVLELRPLPKLPAMKLKEEYDRAVERSKQDMAKKQDPAERRLGLPPPPAPDRPPPLIMADIPLKELLPDDDAEYPNLTMEIAELPSLVSIPAGTTLDQHAVEDMVSQVMSHPYLRDEREDGEAETYEERKARIERELDKEPVSGVSWMYRKNHVLYFRERVTLKAFDQMICRPPLNRLTNTRSDAVGKEPTCEFEELYHPLLWEHTAGIREAARQADFLKRTVARWQHLTKVLAMDGWVEKTAMRRSARKLLWRVNRSSRWSFQIKGLTIWKRFTTASSSALDLQRVFRGSVARKLRRYLIRLHHAAVYVQKMYKARLALRRMKEEVKRRNFMAREIQRCWRGRMGRYNARLVLMTKVRRQHGMIRRAYRLIQKQREDTAARAIQAVYRGHVGRKIAADRRDFLEGARKVELEMEAHAKEQRRLQLLAEAQEEDRRREAHARSEQRKKDIAYLSKVRALRWRREVAAMIKKQTEEQDEVHREVTKRNKEMRREWKRRRDEVLDDVREETLFLLENTRQEAMLAALNVYKIRHKLPMGKIKGDALAGIDDSLLTADQRVLQREMFLFIEREAARLIREVKDNSGQTLLDDEARTTGIENWIKVQGNVKLKEAKEHEKDELNEYLDWKRDKEGTLNSRHRQQWRLREILAAEVFQRNYRLVQARRARKQLALDTYEKFEEEVTGDVYWIDKRHGTRHDTKPPALGRDDVPVQFIEAEYDAYDVKAIAYRKKRKEEIAEEERQRIADEEQRKLLRMKRIRREVLQNAEERSTRASVASRGSGLSRMSLARPPPLGATTRPEGVSSLPLAAMAEGNEEEGHEY